MGFAKFLIVFWSKIFQTFNSPDTFSSDNSWNLIMNENATVSRRGFLNWLILAWATFTLALGGVLSALGRFMFPNVLYEPPSKFKVGTPTDFIIGQVNETYKESHAVWIVRELGGMYVLSTVCTHLGCTPNWLENEQKFKCPCHGSGFRKTGIHFEGPAPRPLERFKIALSDDGQVLIDKSRKFQWEKGQWTDPDAYLPL